MITRLFVEEFKRLKPSYVQLEQIVSEKLQTLKKEHKLVIVDVEHRIKDVESLRVKLSRYGDYYQKFEDLSDLFGARIICFFNDGIDFISNIVAQMFDVDFELSSDKRETIDPVSFGYISLHYICTLKKDQGYPEELTKIKFEIQIRSILQHAWALINHEFGYKSDFGVPRIVTRQFARIAGLLETADDDFVRCKNAVIEYENNIRNQIINDTADDIIIDIISLREYMFKNKNMASFLTKLASIENSEIDYISPEAYLKQLKHLDVTTIGQLKNLISNNEQTAYLLAKEVLEGSELDIISSNIALRYLCFSEMCSRNYNEDEITQFLLISMKDESRARKQATNLLKRYNKIIDK